MKTLLTLFVLFFSSSILAEEEKYIKWGTVVNTCEDTIEFINMAADAGVESELFTIFEYRAVIQSYMSGLNESIYTEFGKYKFINYNSADYAYSYVMNYCEKNPEKTFGEAIIEYLVTLPFIENE